MERTEMDGFLQHLQVKENISSFLQQTRYIIIGMDLTLSGRLKQLISDPSWGCCWCRWVMSCEWSHRICRYLTITSVSARLGSLQSITLQQTSSGYRLSTSWVMSGDNPTQLPSLKIGHLIPGSEVKHFSPGRAEWNEEVLCLKE